MRDFNILQIRDLLTKFYTQRNLELRIYLSEDLTKKGEEIGIFLDGVKDEIFGIAPPVQIYQFGTKYGEERRMNFTWMVWRELKEEIFRGTLFGAYILLSGGYISMILKKSDLTGFHDFSIHLQEDVLQDVGEDTFMGVLRLGRKIWSIGGGVYGYCSLVPDTRHEHSEDPKIEGINQELAALLHYEITRRSHTSIPLGPAPDLRFDFPRMAKRKVPGIFWANFLNPFHIKAVGGIERIRGCVEFSLEGLSRMGILLTYGGSPFIKPCKRNIDAFQAMMFLFQPIIYEPAKLSLSSLEGRRDEVLRIWEELADEDLMREGGKGG
jgi:hypothetical protein